MLLAQSLPDTPKALRPPKDQPLLFRLSGIGSQIYICQNFGGIYGWKLKGPDAKLYRDSGELAGRHFAGPTWEANDGSRVTGKMVVSVPSPNAGSIPWLLLNVSSREGKGTMTRAESIQRLDTKGGVTPAKACDSSSERQEAPVPYEATYWFYGTR